VITLDALALPGLAWTDEHRSAAVAQTTVRTLSGGVTIYAAGLAAGRPITLEAQADQGWLTREQADALLAMAAVPGRRMMLAIRGAARVVVFDHANPPAVDLHPLVWRNDDEAAAGAVATRLYTGTLKLLTV